MALTKQQRRLLGPQKHYTEVQRSCAEPDLSLSPREIIERFTTNPYLTHSITRTPVADMSDDGFPIFEGNLDERVELRGLKALSNLSQAKDAALQKEESEATPDAGKTAADAEPNT